MCRQSQLRGLCFLSFGIGLLTGCWIESGFWCCVLGVGIVAFGLLQLQKK